MTSLPHTHIHKPSQKFDKITNQLIIEMHNYHCYNLHVLPALGQGDEKGKVMGIFRSLGALSRALGPFLACAGTASNVNFVMITN